mmetsp:Transcript_88982/g.157547  ORF Transcript_88982/g.157547 Transcript_88982/m.157547 type:complete len:1931 (-) Transcript_88982:53-5845(-)
MPGMQMVNMSKDKQRHILTQRILEGHKSHMQFYEVYQDLLEKQKRDSAYLCVKVHDKELHLVPSSCGFFREDIPQLHALRLKLVWITEWRLFENIVQMCIILNGLIMAHPVSYDPDNADAGMTDASWIFDTLVTGLFISECIMRIIARGFFFGHAPTPCYLREASNWLDFFVVSFSVLEFVAAGAISKQDAMVLRVLRVSRISKLIRGITALPRLRLIVTALGRSVYRLGQSFMAIAFTLVVITTFGTNAFGDVYWRRCRMTETPEEVNGTLVWPIDYSQERFCGGRYQCGLSADGQQTYCGSPVSINDGPLTGYDAWPEIYENINADNGFTGYQTLWSGLITTFQVVNIEGWTTLLNRFMDAKWPDLSTVYFILLMLFGGLVLMNLVLAILWESFDKTVREDKLSVNASEKTLEIARSMDPKPEVTQDIIELHLPKLVGKVTEMEEYIQKSEIFRSLDKDTPNMGLKNVAYSIIANVWFGRLMLATIMLNAVTMSFDGYPPQDDTLKLILDRINFMCALIFFVEVVLKIIGIGVAFFEDNGNRFDFLLVMISCVEVFSSGGSALSALRTARLLRIFRMLNMSMNLRILLLVFQRAIAPTMYFSMLVIVFLWCACLAGLQLFYQTDVQAESYGLGFGSLGMGLLTVLSIFAGDEWFETAMTQIKNKDNIFMGFLFYLVTFGLGKVILKNLLLGVIAAEFSVARDNMMQDFRLRLAIAQVRLKKVDEVKAKDQGYKSAAEAKALADEDNEGDVPDSPIWPNSAFSRNDMSVGKTCGRNMDILKMIHVKSQAARRLQVIGKIHHMGRSGYKWPQGVRHDVDWAEADVQLMVNYHGPQHGILHRDAKHMAAPPEPSHGEEIALEVRPAAVLQAEPRHFASPPEEATAVLPSPRLQELRRRLKPLRLEPPSQEGERELRCLPVWRLPTEIPEETEKLDFRERYRRAKAARREGGNPPVLRTPVPLQVPDVEAPERGPHQRQAEVQHQTAPEPKTVTLEEKVTVMGEEPQPPPEFMAEEEFAGAHHTANTGEIIEKESEQLTMIKDCAKSFYKSPAFEPVVLLTIIVSSISLAFENPYQMPDSEAVLLQGVVDKVSVGIVTIEMVIRMLVMGLWKSPADCGPGELPGYFRVGWHVVDFIVVVSGMLYIVTDAVASGQLGAIKVVRALKMAGVLRPIRLVSKSSGVRLIIEALLTAIPVLLNMVFICTLFFFGFTLLFVGIFKGSLWHCSLDPTGELRPDIVTRKDCLRAGGEWQNHMSNFDNVGSSLVSLVHMGSGEGWISVILNIIGSNGIDMQPRPNANFVQGIPVLIYMALTQFFLLNLLIGILVDSYSATKAEFAGLSSATSEERLFVKLQTQVLLNPDWLLPATKLQLKGNWLLPLRERVQKLIKSKPMRIAVFVGIAVNAILMAFVSTMANPELADFKSSLAVMLLFFFTVELFLNMFVYGGDFWKDKWNAYDCVAVLGSDIGVVVNMFLADKEGAIAQILGGFQILRMLMLVRYTWFMDSMVYTIFAALPGLINVIALLMLVVFMYACLGVGLFGTIMAGDPQANFHTFGNACLVLVRCSTGERWHEIMFDMAESKPGCVPETQSAEDLAFRGPLGCGSPTAYPYFVSYVIIVMFILMNLIVAVVLDSYASVHDMLDLEDFMVCIKTLRHRWLNLDPAFTGFLNLQQVEQILLNLPQPIGFAKLKRRNMLRQMMSFQVHTNSTVHYRDVVILIAQRSWLFLTGEPLRSPGKVQLDREALDKWNRQFPEIPLEAPPNAMRIAHIVIARRVALYIRKKRWQWKQKGGHKSGSAMKGLQTRLGGALEGPRRGSVAMFDPDAQAGPEEEPQDFHIDAQLAELDARDFHTATQIPTESPTSVFVSQVQPGTPAQNMTVSKLSPLPWPPPELSVIINDGQQPEVTESQNMWEQAAAVANRKSQAGNRINEALAG